VKRTLVVYGNCQAGVLQYVVGNLPGRADQYEVHYFRSFNHPTEGRTRIDPDIMSRCAILWKQLDESAPYEFDGPTPPDMKVVTCPPVDIGALWPFQTHDPLFGPEPDYEYGMFPYGDKVLIDTALEGIGGDAGIARADEIAAQRVVDLDRYVQVEFVRWSRRETTADVKIAPFILANFKLERLFWAYNHPTKRLFGEIANRLVTATWPEAARPESPLFGLGYRFFAEWEPLDHLQVPVHSSVAKRLGLAWWSPDLRYKFHTDRELTQVEYARLYIDERIKRQALAALSA